MVHADAAPLASRRRRLGITRRPAESCRGAARRAEPRPTRDAGGRPPAMRASRASSVAQRRRPGPMATRNASRGWRHVASCGPAHCRPPRAVGGDRCALNFSEKRAPCDARQPSAVRPTAAAGPAGRPRKPPHRRPDCQANPEPPQGACHTTSLNGWICCPGDSTSFSPISRRCPLTLEATCRCSLRAAEVETT